MMQRQIERVMDTWTIVAMAAFFWRRLKAGVTAQQAQALAERVDGSTGNRISDTDVAKV